MRKTSEMIMQKRVCRLFAICLKHLSKNVRYFQCMFGFWTWVTVGYSTDLRLAVRMSQLCMPSSRGVRKRPGNGWRTERWMRGAGPVRFRRQSRNQWAVMAAEVLRG